MNGDRSRHGEGPALGDVARDAMDHASVIVRDEIKIARLEARRYVDHVKRDVAPRALFGVAAAACALLAGVAFLVALFFAILWVLGSIAWSFLVLAVLFTAIALALAGRARRPAALLGSVEIEERFPAVKMEGARREHARVMQESPEAHAAIVEEARREARQERSDTEPPNKTARW